MKKICRRVAERGKTGVDSENNRYKLLPSEKKNTERSGKGKGNLFCECLEGRGAKSVQGKGG